MSQKLEDVGLSVRWGTTVGDDFHAGHGVLVRERTTVGDRYVVEEMRAVFLAGSVYWYGERFVDRLGRYRAGALPGFADYVRGLQDPGA